jgi:hypothetical protein
VQACFDVDTDLWKRVAAVVASQPKAKCWETHAADYIMGVDEATLGVQMIHYRSVPLHCHSRFPCSMLHGVCACHLMPSKSAMRSQWPSLLLSVSILLAVNNVSLTQCARPLHFNFGEL